MEHPARDPQSGPAAHGGAREAGLRIFVVENHDDTRVLLCILLEQMGHVVQSAGTMREALHAIPGSGCDVLISDIGLPDGDGWELMRRLPHRPALALAMSGRGMTGDRARSHAAGFHYHLVKPTGPEELAHILERARHGLRQPETA